MLGPNHHSYHVASQSYGERLSHAARIRMVQKDRHDDSGFNAEAHRLVTARRLAATVAAAVLTATLAAATVGAVAASPNAHGGGITLIR